MTEPLPAAVQRAGDEVVATKTDLDAAITAFEAQLWRGDTRRLALATEAAHAALQSHLDAKSSLNAVCRAAYRP